MVYYIMTVHHKCSEFIGIQYRNIKKNTEPYNFQVGLWVDKAKVKKPDNYLFIVEDSDFHRKEHGKRLDIMSRRILRDYEIGENDIFIFIDGDAFPINPNWIEYINENLQKNVMIAVQRLENGDQYPHPIFAAVRAKNWKRLLDLGATWTRHKADTMTDRDTGGKVDEILRKYKISWLPVVRTNVLNIHPVFYGVYGDMIYHHGASFRMPQCRRDKEKYIKSGVFSDWEFLNKFNKKVSNYMYQKVNENITSFVKMLIGKDVCKEGDSE